MSINEPVRGQKACSICGVSRPVAEFDYGNRERRSYCPSCDKREKAARAEGGVEGAKAYREAMRAKWRGA